MINNLIVKIYTELKNNHQVLISDATYMVLYEILSLKYLSDQKKLSFDDIMSLDDLSNLDLDDEHLSFKQKVNYKKLLHEIQYENLEEIIKEYVNYQNLMIDLISNSNKRLVYLEPYWFDGFYYDLSGNSTYIYKYNHDNVRYLMFKLFDTVLNLNNQYKKINEIDLSEYDEFHYIETRKSFINEKIYDEFINYINNGVKVIYYTNYRCVNNYRKGRMTLRYLKDIIFLPNNQAILEYEKKDNLEISLINYNENDFEKLKKIINNNRKIKDVLIKVNLRDIRKNNYRLGFRLYQLEYENKNKTINEIVDQNTRLIERLERINEDVENEINFLINK